VKLGDLTFPEAREAIAKGAVAILPVGSTEAHGPHLPLATDVVIAEEAARRAVARLRAEGTEAVVLPPVAYGVTDFAKGFAGTITLPANVVHGFVRAICEGALAAGFRAVVISNAHLEPAHIAAIRSAVEGLPKVAFPDKTRRPWSQKLGEEFRSGACHAGSYETSLVQAAAPELVREDLRRTLPENPISIGRAIKEGKTSFEEAGGPDAYFGAPAAASAAQGDELYETLAEMLATAAKELIA